jgi:hypothetical protein
VFIILSLAEIAAPYSHVTFSDPLLLGVFVTGAIGSLISNHARAAKAIGRKTVILVIRDSSFAEFLEKLKEADAPIASIKEVKVADNAEEAVEAIKLPAKVSLLERLGIKRSEKSRLQIEQTDELEA